MRTKNPAFPLGYLVDFGGPAQIRTVDSYRVKVILYH